jgi:hypothetical protein
MLSASLHFLSGGCSNAGSGFTSSDQNREHRWKQAAFIILIACEYLKS